jgi:N-acetyl-alpha-D-glucosaminyl L-malate synthase BshA
MKSKKPLNIVQVFYARPHLGGSGIMSMELAKELAKRGHNVYVVSYPGTNLTPSEERLGIQICPVEMIGYPCFKAEPYSATFTSRIVNLYSEGIDIDIIHANYAITHGEAAITAKRIIERKGGRPKVVITSHGSDVHTNGHHSLLASSIEDTLECADAITFVSQALQDEAKTLFQLNDYGQVIYNFVDETKFKPSDHKTKSRARKELSIPPQAVVVYHASNFREVKHTDILVETANELNKDNHEIYFLMVGDGPFKTETEEKAREMYGLGDRMIFVGKQEDVKPYIHASDIGILPSKREAFGLSLLEVMACGLPVLGSNIGGIPEVISNHETGYLFDSDNVEEIAYYVRKLASDADLRKTMGNAARKKTLELFCRKRIVDTYENLYRRLVDR